MLDKETECSGTVVLSFWWMASRDGVECSSGYLLNAAESHPFSCPLQLRGKHVVLWYLNGSSLSN